MRKNPRPLRKRSLLATSTPGMVAAFALAGRPLLYLVIGVAAAALLLIGYVVAAPDDRDRPFRRVYAVLSLVLDRGGRHDEPPSEPARET